MRMPAERTTSECAVVFLSEALFSKTQKVHRGHRVMVTGESEMGGTALRKNKRPLYSHCLLNLTQSQTGYKVQHQILTLGF